MPIGQSARQTEEMRDRAAGAETNSISYRAHKPIGRSNIDAANTASLFETLKKDSSKADGGMALRNRRNEVRHGNVSQVERPLHWN